MRTRRLSDDVAVLLLVEAEAALGARFVRLPDDKVRVLRGRVEPAAVRARSDARREVHLFPHVAVVAVVRVIVQQSVEVVNVAAAAPVVNHRQGAAVALGRGLQVRDRGSVLVRPDRNVVNVDRGLDETTKLVAISGGVQVLFEALRHQINVDAQSVHDGSVRAELGTARHPAHGAFVVLEVSVAVDRMIPQFELDVWVLDLEQLKLGLQ